MDVVKEGYRQVSKLVELPNLEKAACKGMDTTLFIASDNSPGSPLGSPRIAKAREVCWSCPERRPCLDYALATPALIGIWGGTTAEDRKAMREDRRGNLKNTGAVE